MIELKDQIRLAMERKGLTPEQIAADKRIDIKSSAAVRNWLNGAVPRPKQWKALETILETRFYPTGELPPNTPEFLQGISARDVDLAKKISSMPEVIRHAFETIADNITCYNAMSSAPTEPMLLLNERKTQKPYLVSDQEGATNDNQQSDTAGSASGSKTE